MKLACFDCPTYNTDECLTCRYIQKVAGSVDKGRKNRECMSEDGVVPSERNKATNYNDVLHDNKTAIDYKNYYNNSPEIHKAIIALYKSDFNKTQISRLLHIDRSTVQRVLKPFKEELKDKRAEELAFLMENEQTL